MKQKRLIPDARVRERYGVSAATLWRWDHKADLGFPAPTVINGRKYRDEEKLDQFDLRHAPSNCAA